MKANRYFKDSVISSYSCWRNVDMVHETDGDTNCNWDARHSQ